MILNLRKYKRTILLLLSILVLILVAQSEFWHRLVAQFSVLGYPGAFICGILFVSIFTVAPATTVLFYLVGEYNPILVALFAAAGSVLGDYIILESLEDGVFKEIEPFVKEQLGKRKLDQFFRSPYFSWILPVLGAVIIISPLPDEVGVAMLGLSEMKRWKFVALVSVLDLIGMLLLVITAQILLS